MPDKNTTLALAAGLGIIAGMRSMSAPALLSHRLSGRHVRSGDRAVRLLASGRVASVLKVCAVGELVADKTTFVPDRTAPAAVVGRAFMGALSGVVVAGVRGGSAVAAALAGSAAAVGGTFLAYELRKRAGQRFNVPDPLLGLIEDIMVYASGSRLARAVVNQ